VFRRTQDPLRRNICFNYGAVTAFGGPFQVASSTDILGNSNGVSYNPKVHAPWFGLIPFRSPLLRKSHLLSLPSGTEMFQFPELPSDTYEFSVGCHPITDGGFPHSDIPESTLTYSSSRHIGVSPVLLRLLVPRHSPCALIHLTSIREKTL
jgi:hypothetical protein